MKDIFIDTNAVINFTNPPTEHYKELIVWLKTSSTDKNLDSHLVLSKQLIKEYHNSVSGGCIAENNIHLIIALMTRNNRINSFTVTQINQFKKQNFTKSKLKKFKSNTKDHDHIAAVMLSNRKMGLILDKNFSRDLESFSDAINVMISDTPESLNYSS